MPAAMYVELQYVVPGMKVYKDVYDRASGTVLVSAGTVLNSAIIEKMRNWNIRAVLMEQEINLISPLVDPRNAKFAANYAKTAIVIRDLMKEVRTTMRVPVAEIQEASEEMRDQVISTGNMVDQLYPLPELDQVAHYHATNVSIIATLIALWLKYPPEIINIITMAAMLHDIGKSLLDPELISKKERTETEEQQYRLHCQHGETLVRNSGISESVALAIAQHHELRDGRGFPFGLEGDNIHSFAGIIAVADLFDNTMMGNVGTTNLVSPYQGLEAVRANLHCFDPSVVLVFCRHMTDYLSGNRVQLTDGRSGKVVCVNQDRPSKSIVMLDGGTVIDLESEETRILCVLRDSMPSL